MPPYSYAAGMAKLAERRIGSWQELSLSVTDSYPTQ
jgi:hypothetical protein